jgi:hypothetical protein
MYELQGQSREIKCTQQPKRSVKKKTIFEEMGGTYIRYGDYLIPCLILPEEEEQRFIGVWGQRHKRYLNETGTKALQNS